MSDCFADEIAIDFPSVGPAVERMRDGFLSEPVGDDIVKSDVCLSEHDACRGLAVPIDVPIRACCPDCGGRGESWTEPCGGCCGTGEALFHHAVRVWVPPGVANGARLRFRLWSSRVAPVRVEVRVAVRSSAA